MGVIQYKFSCINRVNRRKRKKKILTLDFACIKIRVNASTKSRIFNQKIEKIRVNESI